MNSILDNTELINEQKSKNLVGMFICGILLGIFGLWACLWYCLWNHDDEENTVKKLLYMDLVRLALLLGYFICSARYYCFLIHEVDFIIKIEDQGCILADEDKFTYATVKTELLAQSTLNMAIVCLSALGLLELFAYWTH